MRIQRRTLLAGAGAAVTLAATSHVRAADAVNPLAAFIAADGGSIKAVQVFADSNGHTKIVDTDIMADHSPYPLFTQFLTHKATSTAIYGAPPHHKIAGGKNAVKSFLFIVAGENTLAAAGNKRSCPTGTVILIDEGSGDGLSQQAGPDGYTAFKVHLAD